LTDSSEWTPLEQEESLWHGFSIAKEIISSHSGKIYAKDREGGGSVFVIELPHNSV